MKEEKLRRLLLHFDSFSQLPKVIQVLGICLLMCFAAKTQHKEMAAEQGKAAAIGTASNRSFSYNLKHKPPLQLLCTCTWST